ncbi:MAG: lipocalin family protein [Dechloromonas sp.]|nr:MAG: lipocalin family protein [Dechloromonas sp.]
MNRLCSTPLALLLALGSPLAGADDLPPVRSVGQIDLARYAGKWFEIAAFPMYFQRNCLGNTTAEYTLLDDGEISVRNRCRTASGFDEANGRAWAPEPMQTAQLKVSFFWPFRSDYWVVGLDPDYRWALVGNPNRKYLWLLSRTPQLPATEQERALQAAAAQGYDLGQLKFTAQGNSQP